jgi:ribosomal protein S20
LLFYILTMNRLRNKENHFFFNSLKTIVKYLGKKLNKGVRDLFNANYKPMKKQIVKNVQNTEKSLTIIVWQN